MPPSTSWHSQWADIDRSADPSSFVRFMDTMRARDARAAQTVPRLYFASMDLQEGCRVLDLGCGTGDEARWMAPLVGATGRVVGVDYSQTMIEEARKRAADLNLPLEFHQGTAYALDFPDDSFDRCRAIHTLSALHDPEKALAEMVRVLRPGGRIVVIDQDWDTLTIDAANHHTTRRVREYLCDSFPSGWVGRRLRGLFTQTGLTDIVVRAGVSSWTDHNADDPWWESTLRRVHDLGMVTAEDAAAWREDLRQRAAADAFWAGVMVFMASGIKP